MVPFLGLLSVITRFPNASKEKTVLTRKGKRGPLPTGKGTLVGVRLQPDILAWLDDERAKLDPEPTRPEMVRIYLEERRGRVIVRD